MDPNTPNTQEADEIVAPEQGNVPELTEDEAIAEVLARHEAGAATDSATEEPKEPEADNPAAEETEKAKEEVEPEEKPAEEVESEPFTEEQLRDPAFFDKLDKDGWKKLEDWNPALYRKAKAVYSALGKANSLAQQAKAQQPAEEHPQTQAADERKALLAKLDSLDDDERAAALDAFVEQKVAQLVPKLTGIKPEVARAREIEGSAYRMAVETMPQIADLDEKALDAAVESDADMMADVRLATKLPEQAAAELLASVMRRAARTVIAAQQAETAKAEAKRQAEAAKLKERQARVNANAKNPSAAVHEHAAARVPGGELSIEEIYEAKLKELGG